MTWLRYSKASFRPSVNKSTNISLSIPSGINDGVDYTSDMMPFPSKLGSVDSVTWIFRIISSYIHEPIDYEGSKLFDTS